MTAAIQRQTRRPKEISDRRRVAYERAQLARAGQGKIRSRFREDVSRDPKPLGFYMILAVSLTLVLFGLVMVLSASSITSFHKGGSPWKLFIEQSMMAGIGGVGMFLAYVFRLDYLRHLARVLPWVGIFLMFMAFIPKFGVSHNGARAWIEIFGQRFQPSEFTKLFLIIFGADLLANREKEMGSLKQTMKPFLVVVGFAVALSAAQSDIGSCIVMMGIATAVLFLAGAPLRPMVGLGLLTGIIGFLVIRSSPEKMARFTSFLHLEELRESDSYQVYQAMISLSNGGVTGTGIGAGSGKWGYVPLAHSDFIFSILAEEMGLLGVFGLLTLFAFLIYFGLQVALSCRHRFGMLLAGGISAWFLIQIVINIGGVIGMIPVTGLTLPFISYGGSSLIVTMVACGLLMNVARRPR